MNLDSIHLAAGPCPGLLSDLRRLVAAWDETQPPSEFLSQIQQLLSSHGQDYLSPDTDKTPGRKRMAATYQKGSIERTGNWYYVRFRRSVPGQKRRKKEREKL